MSDLAEFLLARISEDEASVKRGPGVVVGVPDDCWGPDRVLAECEAKRAIIAGYRMALRDSESRVAPLAGTAKRHLAAYSRVMKSLARVYADHPDFRPEWKR